MDSRQFAHHLLGHPETARAVMSLVDAEAMFEEDSKHFPYTESGGNADSQKTAERLSALARLLAGDDKDAGSVGRDWTAIGQLAERGLETLTTQEWQPDPECPGRSKLVRTKTVREVYNELAAYVSAQREGETWTIWMDGIEEGLCISLWQANPDTTPWPASERVVVFSLRGGSEGDYVHVEALTDQGHRPLLVAKTFMGRDAAWTAARRIADLLGL